MTLTQLCTLSYMTNPADQQSIHFAYSVLTHHSKQRETKEENGHVNLSYRYICGNWALLLELLEVRRWWVSYLLWIFFWALFPRQYELYMSLLFIFWNCIPAFTWPLDFDLLLSLIHFYLVFLHSRQQLNDFKTFYSLNCYFTSLEKI